MKFFSAACLLLVFFHLTALPMPASTDKREHGLENWDWNTLFDGATYLSQAQNMFREGNVMDSLRLVKTARRLAQ
jgi:hypothetical protein